MGSFVTGQPMAPCKTCNGIRIPGTGPGFRIPKQNFAGLQIPDSLTCGKTSTQTSPSKLGDGWSSLKILSFTRAKFSFAKTEEIYKLPCTEHSSKRNLLSLLMFSKTFCTYLCYMCYIEALFFLLFM